MFRLLQHYLEANTCRRRLLIEFFSKEQAANMTPNKRCCDNCSSNKIIKPKIPELDLREDVQKLLGAVRVLDGKFGLGVPIKFLMGKKEDRISNSYTRHALYGSGKDDSEKWWKAIGRLLVKEGLLEEKAVSFGNRFAKGRFPCSTTDITTAGERFLTIGDEDETVRLVPTPEIMSLAGRKLRLAAVKAFKEKAQKVKSARISGPTVVREDEQITKNLIPLSAIELSQAISENERCVSNEEAQLQNAVYTGLMSLRSALAVEMDCMPYMVANNKTLLELAKLRPTNKEQLAQVEGFGQVKVDKFGDAFLAKIKELSTQCESTITMQPQCITATEEEAKTVSQATTSFEQQKISSKKKGVSYESDEDAVDVKEENQLWEDDIDESYLAEMALDNSIPPLATTYVKMEKDQTVCGDENDVWGTGDDDWDNDLETSLAKAEEQALSSSQLMSQRTVKVDKKRPIVYDSDEDVHLTRSSPSKKRSNSAVLKCQMTPKELEVEKKRRRKMKLKNLLA
ncbi:Werner syndrome ATP-dependent helicase-like [Homalodisca vitripennis]|uniref:Werner syndrome ATP-dependent helicase-like n=1 Tax=Homalodisca vitripennis TaxID=197043 RepID=UPI001EEAA87F|nr:Werner syndrome ATP-dependent helicase-like [Homalodisca vitripennis]